jgi:RNA polymerase sigma factor (sigma-70 family)
MSKSDPLFDQTIIDLINKGDKDMNQAAKVLLEHYGDRIKHHILELSQNMEEAEDVLYEGVAAFLLNVRKGSFKGESAVSSYLFSICRRIWFKKFKRMMLHKKFEEMHLAEVKHAYEEVGLTDEIKAELNQLMGLIKEKCQEILRLWSLSYNMTEIAERLNYSSSQVAMNKKNLCLKEVRSQLKQRPTLARNLLT